MVLTWMQKQKERKQLEQQQCCRHQTSTGCSFGRICLWRLQGHDATALRFLKKTLSGVLLPRIVRRVYSRSPAHCFHLRFCDRSAVKGGQEKAAGGEGEQGAEKRKRAVLTGICDPATTWTEWVPTRGKRKEDIGENAAEQSRTCRAGTRVSATRRHWRRGSERNFPPFYATPPPPRQAGGFLRTRSGAAVRSDPRPRAARALPRDAVRIRGGGARSRFGRGGMRTRDGGGRGSWSGGRR
ncbi:hypothetical protein GN956_G4379 [Arapaima gigas]